MKDKPVKKTSFTKYAILLAGLILIIILAFAFGSATTQKYNQKIEEVHTVFP